MAKQPEVRQFRPKNPHKYMGKNLHDIRARSSWEISCMMCFDLHESVIGWTSEGIAIPYFNPLTRKNTLYVPDFVVVYCDKYGNQITEMIEVKPKDEMPGAILKEGNARSFKIKQGRQIINQAKWAEAVKFCQRRGWKFRVACEDDMFAMRKYKGPSR